MNEPGEREQEQRGSAREAELASALHSAVQTLEAWRARERAPIAITGLSCRLPGASTSEEFARLLDSGRAPLRTAPTDRESLAGAGLPPASYLDDVASFDHALFGISPREAEAMDPQQRLLLELTWEALEDAAESPDVLRGHRVGVFLGLGQNDWAQRRLFAGDAAAISPHDVTGNGLAFVAGRLSHAFGWRGPCQAIDTACSSALVALHEACRALRAGDCELAVVGAMHLILSPEIGLALQRSGALAADGRSKAFDASADGFGRGEGGGVLVLRRQEDAEARGAAIHALVRGSAVNHAGASGGLTVPSGEAQADLLRDCLQAAGLEAADLDLVEAHGTGTTLGDPIELAALARVFNGRERPLAITSVKAVIGHLEAAAGFAGLLRLILAFREDRITAQRDFATPNPRFDWAGSQLEVPCVNRPWPRGERKRRAGGSAFGMGGTNAHAILEEAPVPEDRAFTASTDPQLVTLSAGSEEGLRRLIEAYRERLASPDAPTLPGLARTSRIGRAHLPHRLGIVSGTTSDLAEALGAEPSRGHRGHAISGRRPKIAFVFTGQGAQQAAMAAELRETEPAFRATWEAAATRLANAHGLDLDAIVADEDSLRRTAHQQPALFALQWALVELWRARGISPELVLGHSVGEIAAACAAGACDWTDGLDFMVRRGAAMDALPVAGGMLSAACSEATAERALEGLQESAAIAAINGPERLVLSGDVDALELIAQRLHEEGIATRALPVSQAFHSPLLEDLRDELEAMAPTCRPLSLPLVSTLTARVERRLPEGHWTRHALEPVRFHDAIGALLGEEPDVLVEIGPKPVLLGLAAAELAAQGVPGLASLRAGESDRETILAAQAALYCLGAEMDWRALDTTGPAPLERLPTLPMDRTRHWLAPVTPAEAAAHALLGRRLPQRADRPDEHAWDCELSHAVLPQIGAHRLDGIAFVPGIVYSELAGAALGELFPGEAQVLEDVEYEAVFFLPEGAPRRVQVLVKEEAGGRCSFEIRSRHSAEVDAAWTLNARGRSRPAAANAQGAA